MARTLNATLTTEKNLSKNEPIEFYDVFISASQTLYFVRDNQDQNFFTLAGTPQLYTAIGLSRESINTSVDSTIDQTSIKLDNINKNFAAYIESNTIELRNKRLVIRKAFRNQLAAASNAVIIFDGLMDEPIIAEKFFETKVKSKINTLTRECPRRLYQLLCPWKFAGTECTIDKNLPANKQTGTAGAGSTTTIIYDAARTEATNYWKDGTVEWTSGVNNGIKRKVTANQTGQFTLDYSLPNTPGVGDTYTIYRGCGKTLDADCGTKFNNKANFGGFHTLPEQLVREG